MERTWKIQLKEATSLLSMQKFKNYCLFLNKWKQFSVLLVLFSVWLHKNVFGNLHFSDNAFHNT